MLKREYENLKTVEFRKLEHFIRRMQNDEFESVDNLTFGIGLSVLAIAYKTYGEEYLNHLEDNVFDKEVISFLLDLSKLKNRVIDLSDSFELEELQAYVLFGNDRSRDRFPVPEGVSKLVSKLLKLHEGGSLIDQSEDLSTFLIEARFESQLDLVFQIEQDVNNIIISGLREYVSGKEIEILQSNVLSRNYNFLNVKKVFANCPFRTNPIQIRKYIEDNDVFKKYLDVLDGRVSFDWAYALSAFENTAKDGRTVVIMPNNGIWHSRDELLRKMLIERNVIEGVILLPEKLFGYTNLALTIVVFGNTSGQVRMVDASSLFTEGRRINTLENEDIDEIFRAYESDSRISTSVGNRKLSESEYILNPLRYIERDYSTNGVLSLGDVCKSINRGAMISKNELESLATKEITKYKYLMLGNINDGLIDDNLLNLSKIESDLDRFCVKNGNIVISKNAPFKVAIAKFGNGIKVLANGNMYYLEIDENKINPVFLGLYLNSKIGIGQLEKYARGATIKSLSIRDLREVRIPNISRENQDQVAEIYQQLNAELEHILIRLDYTKHKLNNLIDDVLGEYK